MWRRRDTERPTIAFRTQTSTNGALVLCLLLLGQHLRSFSFIWNKKIEKQLASGVSVKDLDARAERERQHHRLVPVLLALLHF